MQLPKLHTWQWALDHSDSRDIQQARDKGFNTASVLPYYYKSQRSITGIMEGKMILIHAGELCRFVPYSKEMQDILCLA